jgi:hypothetical protein
MSTNQLYGGQPDTFEVQSASVVPVVGPPEKNQSWLDWQHPMYKEMAEKWQLTADFYLGEVADEETGRKYLIKRFQGEPEQAFKERLKCADFTPHLGTLLDTIAGMLFGTEDRTSRVWTGEDGVGGLGDPNKAGTTAHRLVRNADGRGTQWKTIWREFTLDILCFQYMWVLVDTVGGVPSVKLVSPTVVPNWIDSPNGPIAVVMAESNDVRKSLEDKPSKQKSWLRWETTGWSRWTKDEEGNPKPTGESGTYAYKDRAGNPTLPIFRVDLPMRRYVAWLLAKKAQVLYNQESVRDFGLRIAAFSKLVVSVADSKQITELRNMLSKGENVIPVDNLAKFSHAYIAPPSEPVMASSEVLNKKIEDYWLSGFQQYADAAAQKTATEIKQDVASGIGAFLQLLAAAVDDAENGAMWRLEQAEFSESKGKWGVAHVERTDDFSTMDLAAVLDKMKVRYLGETGMLPVGRGALIQLAKDAAQFDGLPVDQAEIEAAVDAFLLKNAIADLQVLNVTPPLVKARLAMKLVAAMGLIDPNEVIELSDGEKQLLMDAMMTQAQELADVQDKQARMQAEMPPFSGGGGGGFGGK